MEWSEAPWRSELSAHGFEVADADLAVGGRRGVLVHSERSGRRGVFRTFWMYEGNEPEASSLEGYFDFDVENGEEPVPLAGPSGHLRVADKTSTSTQSDVMGRCFRFRFEKSWREYYQNTPLDATARAAVERHCLGQIALDVPAVLAFLLLLASRTSLPHRAETFEKLNAARRRAAKTPLLEHIVVSCPMLPRRDSPSTLAP